MAGLKDAYLSTQYVVLDDIGVAVAAVKVGEVSAELDELLEAYDATAGVFITAHNPRSEPRDAASNDAAHERLDEELAVLGVISLPHIGIGDDPHWVPEHGLFVIDLDEAEAVRVATAYEQNAIVVAPLGEPARLVLTEVMGR